MLEVLSVSGNLNRTFDCHFLIDATGTFLPFGLAHAELLDKDAVSLDGDVGGVQIHLEYVLAVRYGCGGIEGSHAAVLVLQNR